MGNRGQNVVEYILVVTAVVLVFVVVFAPNGRFHRAVKQNLDSVVPAIDQGSDSIRFSGSP